MYIRTVAAVAAVFMGVATVEAATLDEVQGRILVSRGGGFRPISGPVNLQPGMQVMANPNSSASIVYSNGCRDSVEPGTVVTVKPEGACTLGDDTSPYALGAIAVGGGAALAIGLSRRDRDNKPASP
jgi:hypothetical protein